MLNSKIAIIGAGVSGTTSALYLSQLGLDVTLFEKSDSVSSGPPYCHLHAGGNLYRELSEEECVSLLKQSISFVKFFPYIVDYRPTVITIPKKDKGNPNTLIPRLQRLQKEYQLLIEKDSTNAVLGTSESYYKLYHECDIRELEGKEFVENPKCAEDWIINAINCIDINSIKFPIVLVNEYGMNLFRFTSGAQMALKKIQNIEFLNNTTVHNVCKNTNNHTWKVSYQTHNDNFEKEFDYLINATGYKSGTIDDMLNIKSKRFVEFKASYIAHWQSNKGIKFPEIIFHGERGTPSGMAQFTPYPGGYFQLHGMSDTVTLFKNSLSQSTPEKSQPYLEDAFNKKLDEGWDEQEVTQRTQAAVSHVAQFIPSFSNAKVAAPPLFGAQQIPGDNPILRVAEVAFDVERYARSEIVKVSSSIDMVERIIDDMVHHDCITMQQRSQQQFNHLDYIDTQMLERDAEKVALSRGFPVETAHISVSSFAL